MPASSQTARLRKQIIGYSVLGVVATGLVVSILGVVPLYRWFLEEKQGYLLQEAKKKALAVEQYLNYTRGLARQISTRRHARELLQAYNALRLRLAELEQSTQKIMAEAMSLSDEMAGISRLDAAGHLVVQIGSPIPRESWPVPPAASREALIHGPLTFAESSYAEPYLIVGMPILDERSRRVGTDIVLFNTQKLRGLVQGYAEAGAQEQTVLGRLSHGKVETFFGDRREGVRPDEHPAAAPILEALTQGTQRQSGILFASPTPDLDLIVAYAPVPGTDWAIAVKTDQHALYSVIYRQLLAIGGVVLFFLALGTYGLTLLLRPLTGRMLVHTDELEQDLKEKTLALQNELSQRRQIEVTLRRHTQILDQVHDSVVATDLEGFVTSWNKGAERLFGYSADEARGRHISFVYPAEEQAFLQTQVIAPLKQKGWHEVEVRMRRKSGEDFFAHLSLSMLREGDAEVGMIGYSMDITGRKRMEQALRESEERLRTLLETTSDWVWEVDERGVYTYASPKVRDLLGYEPREVLGRTPFDFMPPAEAARVGALFAEYVKTRALFTFLENVNLHKDGREVVLETSGVPFFDVDGKFRGYRGVDRDITGKKT
jgi:PAS domain S-box-containing protein